MPENTDRDETMAAEERIRDEMDATRYDLNPFGTRQVRLFADDVELLLAELDRLRAS